MNVKLRLFASVADALGVRELDLELPDNATAADALDALASRYPAARGHRQGLAIAVNMAYAGLDHALREGDELALIPPVSGGK
jgi:molybdopterin converting factor subunit 1